jgi:flagellar capping protein FliD
MIDHSKFVMSKYVSMEDLLRDKCKALEEENKRLLQRLHTCKRRNREDKQRMKRQYEYELWSRGANHEAFNF